MGDAELDLSASTLGEKAFLAADVREACLLRGVPDRVRFLEGWFLELVTLLNRALDCEDAGFGEMEAWLIK